MGDLPTTIVPNVTPGHVPNSDVVHSLVNSIRELDPISPQSTIDSDVPSRTEADMAETLALRRLWLTAGFVITTPLLMHRAMGRMEGTSEGVLLRNSTNGSDVVRMNESALSDSVSGYALARMSIKGTGTASRGVYANFVEHMAMLEVNFIGHPGTALYLESTNPLLRGVAFGYFRQILAQPPNGASAAVSLIVDNGGRFNRFQSCRGREGEVAFDLINTDGDHISEAYVETNTRGTAKTAIRNRTTDNLGARRGFRVTNTYSENNPGHFIDVDSHTFTVVDGGRATGGCDEATKTWREAILLNGGGLVRAFRGNGGTYLSSKRGVIRAEGCDGVVGRVDEVSFVGLVPPFDTTAHNLASHSCFDVDAAWAAGGGGTAPALSYDGTVHVFASGKGSKKAVFPTGGSGGSFSRANMTNTELTLAAGDDYYTAVLFKSDVAGEEFRLRHVGAADGNLLEIITDTVWQVAILSTVNILTPGAYHLAWEIATPLAATTTIWTGAVAASTNSGIAFKNTDGISLQPGDVEAARFVLGNPQTYTPSNVTPDRAFDANATTLDEVADVLGTLITDLQAAGLVR